MRPRRATASTIGRMLRISARAMTLPWFLPGVDGTGAPAALSDLEQAPESKELCHEGVFSNETFLYSIAVPTGLRCCHDPAPMLVHGCATFFPDERDARLWVDGSYNATDLESVEEALRSTVGHHLVPGTTLAVLRHETAKLGDFEAVRLTLRITTSEARGARIEDLVMALADREGRGEILYTVGLIAPEGEYPEGAALLAEVVASWKALEPSLLLGRGSPCGRRDRVI